MSQRFRRSRPYRSGSYNPFPSPTYHWSNISKPEWWSPSCPHAYSSPASCVVLPFDEYGAASDMTFFHGHNSTPKSWSIPFFSGAEPHGVSHEDNDRVLREDVAGEPVTQGALMPSGISKEKISAFVRDNLLKNHNIAYLPDYVEGALYENAVTALMALLEGVITTSKIEVLGHVINFSIHPIADSSPNETTQPPAI